MAGIQVSEDIADALFDQFKIRIFPAVKDTVRIENATCQLEPYSQIFTSGALPVGRYSYTQSSSPGIAKIGRYCSIGSGLTQIGDSHPIERISTHPALYKRPRYRMFTDQNNRPKFECEPYDDRPLPIEIGNDVWIADNVSIKGGVRVGDGAVLAYGAIVTKDVPPYAIVGGTPAKIIKYRFEKDVIARALASQWWDYGLEDIAQLPTEDPEAFLDAFESRKDMFTPVKEDRRAFEDYIKALK